MLDFPKGKVIYNKISSAGEIGYEYQLYHAYGSNDIYK